MWRSGTLTVLLAIVGSLASAGCSRPSSRLEAYNDYAIQAARLELWKEAALRWQQAVELAPQDARLWNNLAVAFEAENRLDEALDAYARALELDPDNTLFRRNWIRCRRRLERQETVAGPVSSPDKESP